MKRITLLLSLLLACFGVTMAQQVTDISQFDANKVYTLSTARGGWAVSNDLSSLKSTNDVGLTTNKDTWSKYYNTLFQFVVVTEDENTSYYLYNALAKKYANNEGSFVDNISEATPIQFNKQNDNTFVLYFDNTHYLNIGGSNQASIDNWSTPDEGNKITIEAAGTLTDLVNVTYNYQLNGSHYKTVSNFIGIKNSDVNEVVTGNTLIIAESVEPTTLTDADAQTVTVNCKENLPFEKTTDLNNPKWYAVSLHTNQNFYLWHYVANDALVETPVPAMKASDYTVVEDDAYFWCFTGDLVNGFRIYNKKAGTGYTLNSTAGNATIGTADSDNDLWDIVPATIDKSIAFSKRGETSGSRFLNHNGGLKYHSASDEGSSALFYEPASFPVNLIESYTNSTAPAKAVGTPVNPASIANILEQAQTTLDAAKAEPFSFDNANELKVYAKQLAESPKNEIVSGGYYHIYSALAPLYAKNKGLYYKSDNGKFEWATIDDAHVDHIIKIVERTGDEAGKYDFYTCNAKKYMQGVAGASNTTTGSNPIDFVDLGDAQYNIHFANGTMHANGHGNGSGESGTVISYSGNYNSASSWYIVPAENIEVALTTVDDASYATAYLPFPVQGDGETKVYTGTAEGDVLNMTEQTGVIPAETGVVLKGAANAEKTILTIGGEATADVNGNSLSGTLTALTSGFANYLVLGVGNISGEIGFYAPGEALTTIAANKAFLPTTSMNAIAMNFDGQTTAINNAVNDTINTHAPVFDLSGRRVMNTLKGGIYIRNGKKFIVK